MEFASLVVFDMAGTTVCDRGEVPEAFTAALLSDGIEVAAHELVALRGCSKREAIRRLVPDAADRDARAARLYEAFRSELARRYTSHGVEPIQGARDVFDWCRSRGMRVALNTGFDRSITALILKALGWDAGVVDAVVCGDDVSRGRPAPLLILEAMRRTSVGDPARVASCGDTLLDLEAGRSAGVRWNVGVLSGAHDRALLETGPHTHLLASVAALPGVWDEAA